MDLTDAMSWAQSKETCGWNLLPTTAMLNPNQTKLSPEVAPTNDDIFLKTEQMKQECVHLEMSPLKFQFVLWVMLKRRTSHRLYR